MQQFFLSPGLLWGLFLVGVPIVIYLINRQRYQRRRWAAMEFLLKALKRNQRRIQLQNILLLLVRVGIVFLLVLAMARPVQRHGVLTVAPEENQNWILAADTSYSMGYQEAASSFLDQAKESMNQLCQGVFKSGDRIALMEWGRKPRVLLDKVDFTEENKSKLLREIESLELSAGAVDIGSAFSVLDDLCGRFATRLGEPEPKRIVLLSDLQRKDWLGDQGVRTAGILPYIDKIQQEGGEFALAVPSQRGVPLNLAVTELSVSPALVAKDVPVELRVVVRNFGDGDAEDVELTIQVDRDPEDASAEPQVGNVIRVPAGGSITRVLPYKFASAGFHGVVAGVRSDGLSMDNRRYLAVRVEETVKVLLVDGDPAADALDRETFHLALALEPEDDSLRNIAGRFSPFDTEYRTVDQLGDVQWKEYAVVVLANVGEMPLSHVEEIKKYVNSGGACMVFLGANVRPEFYNQYFRGGEEGFLPGTLKESRGDSRYPVYLEVADANHPVAKYFEEHKDVTHLQRPIVAFYKYSQVAGLDPKARVAFRYNDADGTPAVFDNRYGSGRVLWMTSTADQDWNEFSVWPDYVVFLYESISYLVRFGMSSMNLEAGDMFRKVFPGSEYAPEVVLLAPDPGNQVMGRAQSIRKAMRNLSSGNDFELTHEDTEVPGLYRLDLLRSPDAGGNTTEYFSVNVDTEESDLRPMTEEDFRTHCPDLRYALLDAGASRRAAEGEKNLLRGREHSRLFLFAVLGLALLETVLAYFFGRRAR